MGKRGLIFLVLTAGASGAFAQLNDRNHQGDVFLDNKPKPGKESTARTIQGIVKDASDSPVRGAIVHLKDTKSSKVIDYATKDDGLFVFRELSMDITYELAATRGDAKAPTKTVSPYDTRKAVTLTFKLEEPKTANP